MDAVPKGFILALVLVTGLIFGSFVTMASYRLPRDEPIGGGRSRCPSCQKSLGALALIPLFSWLIQRGSCCYCRARISLRYPLTECAQALLFFWVYSALGVSWEAAIVALLSVCLLILFVVDFEWKIIPDEVQIAMLLLGVGYHLLMKTPVTHVLSGFAVGAAIGLGLYYGYSRLRGIEILGFGDVKFLMVAGIWMADVASWPAFLFYAGIFGIFTAVIWRMAGRGARFPFGPALGMSLLITLLTDSTALFFWTVGGIYR